MFPAKVAQDIGRTASEDGEDAPPPTQPSPDAGGGSEGGPPARAFRNTMLSVLSQGVVSGTNFLTTVAVGRACGQETLGNYALTLSILLFLRAVQSDGIGSAYIVYCSRRRGEESATYAGSTLVHQLTLSAAAFAGLLGLAAALSLGGGSAGLTSAVWGLLGAVPFLLLRDQVRLFAFAHLRLGTALALDAAAAVLQLGSLAMLARFGLLNAATAYAVMGGACALICLAWFLFGGQPLRFDRGRLLPDWRHNWTFSRWALASQFVNRAVGYLMPWVVAAVHGEAAVGLLAACVSLANVAGTFITGVSSYLAPHAAHAVSSGGVAPLRRVVAQTVALYLVVVGAFCLIVLVGGESVTLVATAAALAALVGPFGVMGAALATLAGSVVGAAVRAATLWRIMCATAVSAVAQPETT
jgi:O-antigen/teichoic acid export membrane protein